MNIAKTSLEDPVHVGLKHSKLRFCIFFTYPEPNTWSLGDHRGFWTRSWLVRAKIIQQK